MHIVVTGGTRGIGYGLVDQFAIRGHKVSFSGTSTDSVSRALGTLSGLVNGVVCDVRNVDDIKHLRDASIEQFGPIDVWINNAGVNQGSLPLSSLDSESIKKVIDINVTGMIQATKIALEHMIETSNGIVYNMEGLGSNNMMIANTIIYGSSKRLLTYFSKACNKELKRYPNIYVGTLQPGMVFTDLLMDTMSKEGMRVARILGRPVSTVAPFLVQKILKRKKRISYLTTWRALYSFISYPLRKGRVEVQ